MKKLFFILCLLPSLLWAAPVDPNMAQQVAENFINAPEAISSGVAQKSPKRISRSSRQISVEQKYYIFNSEDGEGFIIVAADDVAHPVLGYSSTGSFSASNLPENLRWWLSEYDRQISWAQENNIEQSSEIAQEWHKLLSNNAAAASVVVGPLVQTKWDQAPYYNDKCPYNYLVLERTVTGCAATALAQVMKFWEWPVIGDGYHQYNCDFYGTQSANFGATIYDWDNMPNQLSSSSSSSQVNAVSTLMYHCGVAMDMDYGLSKKYWKFNTGGGSAAGADAIANAAVSYFRYSSTTQNVEKQNYNDADWLSLIKGQLDSQHPMVYWGIGDGGGHAFVCDGYDSQNRFHFNWGWSGYCDDAYYALTALNPGPNGAGSGTTGDYTARQGAIINMVPRTQSSNVANLQLNSSWYLSADSIQYGGAIAGSVLVKNYGATSFTGDIIAMVLDKNGNYFADYTIEQNCTIAKNGTLTVTPSVSGNAGLVPGRYYVVLFCRSNDLGYQIVGSKYYTNLATFKVFYHADIETYSDFAIYSEDNNSLVKDHTAQICVTLKNTGSTYFSGKAALVLYTSDLSTGQDFAEIDMSIAGISAGNTRTLTFTGSVGLDPGTYILALMYYDSNYNFAGSTYYSNPVYVVVRADGEEIPDDTKEFELKPGKYVIVANREKSGDNNWYYMTSDLGTASTKRFQAVSTETANIDDIIISELEDKYVWELEADGNNWKLKNGTQYVSWSSGNSSKLDATGKSLTFEIEENQVQAHFNDGTNERYLSLNATTGNNYFAFYSGTNQISYLFFLPYEEETPEPPQPETSNYVVLAQRNGSSNWFYMTSDLGTASNKRYQAVDAGTANLADVNSSNLDSKYYWQIEENKLHTAAGYSTWSSGNTANLDNTGKDLTITKQSDSTYTFSFADGADTRYLALNATAGNNYFAYYKGTGQVYKLTLVKEGASGTTTSIENLSLEQQHATKVLINGQIFIVREGKMYTVTGQEVK